MGDTSYVRATRVLWRRGPDRVVVRSVAHDGLDLVGATALVWITLDEPRTVGALMAELAEFDAAMAHREGVEDVLRELLANDLVVEFSP